MHLHVGRKLASLNHGMGQACLRHKVVVQPEPFIRCGSAGEAGPVAARHIGGQGELTHNEQAAIQPLTVQILHAAVHLAGFV
ncbi:hypothetical protein D9M73_26130 [compost metagenome]